RDHHALAHPAGKLVRILVDAPARVRDVDEVEQLDNPLLRSTPRQVEMLTQDLLDLVPDAKHGVQRGHRLLEDERDLAAADLAELGPRRSEQLGALETDAARDRRRLREKPEDRERGHALSAPRLPDDAAHLARAEGEGRAGE